MGITIRFACDHAVTLSDGVDAPPVCPICSERRVRRVTAPAPRFRGTVLGPCAQYEDLPARKVVLTEDDHG